jgi:diguanylate cyclase (GGDEF)-like protein
MGRTRQLVAGRARRLLGGTQDPYAGNDLVLANRLSGFAWAINAAAILVVIAVAPPERGGVAGWLGAAAVMAFSLWSAARLLRGRCGFDEMLVRSYVAVVGLAFLQWLARGGDESYQELYLVWILSVAAVHPLRRWIPFFGFAAVLMAIPPVADGGASAIVDVGIHIGLWAALGAVTNLVMYTHRDQRMELREEREHARRQAGVDKLTGLGNRRAFDEELGRHVARAERRGEPLALILADLDDFKSINDEFGHMNGDECLRGVGDAIASEVRSPDACFRWGGDEFAVILAGADLAGAERAAARLVDVVPRSCRRPEGEPLHISVGVAELQSGMRVGELVGAADLALLASKSRSDAVTG